MKTLKVGSWWNNFDQTQRDAFVSIYNRGKDDVNSIRKYLTAAKKRFANPEYGYYKVKAEGKLWHYSSDRNDFTTFD